MRLWPWGAALMLAGCEAGDTARDQQDPDAAPIDNAATPPAAPIFDWTGEWAATAALCDGGRWRMARDRIATAGETSCAVEGERVEFDGVIALDLHCTAEGTDTRERWMLDPLADGRMKVTRVTGGNVVAEVTLGRCG
ncbi:hypothetical protein SAMN06295912_12223 [Sphingomonas laterariae]|uniref:DUF3617 family protein n=1 Tax=Edaphosphingomonas laterariae TaxID=861865 RepID=A0A239I6Q5_9SPHN|nr:hypothetical protein [Sphingomonas laterariae]SNS89270.1 hypothetical protein SAMN06295912_12223 [Sphingomonas laterariae]